MAVGGRRRGGCAAALGSLDTHEEDGTPRPTAPWVYHSAAGATPKRAHTAACVRQLAAGESCTGGVIIVVVAVIFPCCCLSDLC